jgi:3-oxoacyl-[acyl-carrier protein] reductase
VTYLRQSPETYGVPAAAAACATSPGNALYRARNADSPDAVLRRLRATGARVAAAEFDLSDAEVAPRLLDAVEEALGPVDVLVNNAAYAVSDTFNPADQATTDWAGRSRTVFDAESHFRHFSVNCRAVALLMTEFARRHAARGARWGRIVNISTDGADAFPGEVSYGASKAALEAYSRSAAIELANYGITVNIVAPGPIQTGWIPDEEVTAIEASIPLGRLGEPKDVADVVLFLASEQARWVTGQRLFVGGGHRV